jgi:outer membrane lipoprotein carrier protein
MRRRRFGWSFAVVLLAASSGAVALAQPAPAAAAPAPAAAAAAGQPTPLPGADAVVAKVQEFYDKTTSFKSDFNQTFFVRAYNQKKTSHGRVVFAKPGKMEWVYDEPKDNVVVSDGAILRVYEAQNHQMYEQQVDKVDKSQYQAALSFLTGQGKLSDHFNFQLFAGESMNFPGGLVLVGTPKQPTPAYQKVLFYVDKQTSLIRRAMVLDQQGNRNSFDFVNPKVNEPVTGTQFKFTPPPGTTVVHP